MKIEQEREVTGPHNNADFFALAIPVPSEAIGKGDLHLNWSSHAGADGQLIHSFTWSDENGNRLCIYTAGNKDLEGWSRVKRAVALVREFQMRVNTFFKQLPG